jgi:hypothetical protein
MSLAQLTSIGLVVWTTDGVRCCLTKSTVNVMYYSELHWLSKTRFLQFLSLLEEIDVLCMEKGQAVIYFEDTGWISILAFLVVCGQLNGLRRKLKGSILLLCKLHSLCFIHIFWTTEFVGLQMPWKCCKNTSEGRSVYWTHWTSPVIIYRQACGLRSRTIFA